VSSNPFEYSNNSSPYYLDGAAKNDFGEGNLSPYVAFYGGGINTNYPDTKKPHELQSDFSLLSRYAVVVSPLDNDTYPNSGKQKWLVNLDTEQLYTANPQKDGQYKFGADYVAPASVGSNCWDRYGTSDGVYSSPVPIHGAPVEFRKIYFRGQPVDQYGKISGCVSGTGGSCETYFAYFACSKPVRQDCDDGSGCSYNPRNENYGIQEGVVVDWEDFDIGCGGGGGSSSGSGCSNSYSLVSGTTGRRYEGGEWIYPTGAPSGCDSTLVFSGSCGLFSDVRQAGETTTVTYSINAEDFANCLNTCYNTVIAVTGGEIYSGQSDYTAGTGFCTIRTLSPRADWIGRYASGLEYSCCIGSDAPTSTGPPITTTSTSTTTSTTSTTTTSTTASPTTTTSTTTTSSTTSTSSTSSTTTSTTVAP